MSAQYAKLHDPSPHLSTVGGRHPHHSLQMSTLTARTEFILTICYR